MSPSHGVAPWAAVPATSSRIASTPFAWTPMWRSVGSPVIAKSPVKPLRIRNSVPRSISSSDSSSGTTQRARRSRRRVAQLLERAHHRGERALHVVGAATVDAVAVDLRARTAPGAPGPRRGGRGRHRRALAGPTLAASSGRPRISSSSTGMSRDSKPALDEAGGLADALVVGGVVADQSFGGSLVHAQSSGCASERRTARARWSRQTEARVYRRDPASSAGAPPAGAVRHAQQLDEREAVVERIRDRLASAERQRGTHLAAHGGDQQVAPGSRRESRPASRRSAGGSEAFARRILETEVGSGTRMLAVLIAPGH